MLLHPCLMEGFSRPAVLALLCPASGFMMLQMFSLMKDQDCRQASSAPDSPTMKLRSWNRWCGELCSLTVISGSVPPPAVGLCYHLVFSSFNLFLVLYC